MAQRWWRAIVGVRHGFDDEMALENAVDNDSIQRGSCSLTNKQGQPTRYSHFGPESVRYPRWNTLGAQDESFKSYIVNVHAADILPTYINLSN